MKKKILATAMALAMAMSMALSVSADHVNPKNPNGPTCTNTHYYVSHTGSAGNYSVGSHIWQGATCSITQTVFIHQKTCTSCTAFLGSYTKGCYTKHNKCGILDSGHCY